MVLLYNFQYSLGKIDHNFLHLTMPIFMAFTNWGNHWSVDALRNRKTQYNAPYGLSIFSMGLATAFFIAATRKIRGSWLDFDSQALHYVLNKGSGVFVDWIPIWLLEAGDWLVVGFELSFLLLYPRARWFTVCALAALFFHISVSLSLHIFFMGMPVVYLVYFIRKMPAVNTSISLGSKAIYVLPTFVVGLAILYLYQLIRSDHTFLDAAVLYPLFHMVFDQPKLIFAVSMQLLCVGLAMFWLVKYWKRTTV